MKIKNITFKNNAFLAPMAGVNCTSFRLLCKDYGASLVYTQLFHAQGIVNIYDKDKKKLSSLFNTVKEEKPVSIQLVGNDTEYMGHASSIISKYADIIDINLGCPNKAVLANKAGAFFSKHPEQLKKIVPSVVENSSVPVTAKIRIGWDEKSITVLDSIKYLDDFGVDAIAIHARTRKQVYEGKADWEWIKKAKEMSNVPIIGNGDIFMPGNAKSMIERTNCDFVMVGRGSLGNPFIFERINHLLKEGKNKEEPTLEQKRKCFEKFTKYYYKYDKPFRTSASEYKQHAMWFTKGLKNSRIIRDKMLRMKDYKEIEKYILRQFR